MGFNDAFAFEDLVRKKHSWSKMYVCYRDKLEDVANYVGKALQIKRMKS
jgi:hypothetical protein